MKKNMGTTDRVIRVVIAMILCALYFTGTVTGVPGVVLFIIACIFLLTSVVSFCPIYTLLGINTCPRKA